MLPDGLELSITQLLERAVCPAYQPRPAPTTGAGPPKAVGEVQAHGQAGGEDRTTAQERAAQDGTAAELGLLLGRVLHGAVESYLRNEPVALAFNLLSPLPANPELHTSVTRRICNLLTFANLLATGADAVETEVPISLTLSLLRSEGALAGPGGTTAVRLHGRCDCVITRDNRILVVDWKPSPRPRRLDELQLKFYLYALLTARDQTTGQWLLYYYDTGQIRQGCATRAQLTQELEEVLTLALAEEGRRRPGSYCQTCLLRKECIDHDPSVE